MTEQHPITPPGKLVAQICREALHGSKDQLDYELRMIHIAFRSGADQELEACCEILRGEFNYHHIAEPLRAARRPKPPSLTEEALQELEQLKSDANSMGMGFDAPVIRRALERLQQLEEQQ